MVNKLAPLIIIVVELSEVFFANFVRELLLLDTWLSLNAGMKCFSRVLNARAWPKRLSILTAVGGGLFSVDSEWLKGIVHPKTF